MPPDYNPYLALLKASYDYQPQSDDELAIKENQTLFLLDRVDDDWWKVKIKPDSPDEDGPLGLVPAAYVEPADHVSTVKVLYDYEASASGELSVKEGETLLVYETDQDWLLVQNQDEGGKAGFVPGNYVEATSEEENTPVPQVTEPSSSRPLSTYVDPADRVASSKTSQPNVDNIKTWSVTDIDKKGKKKKGTLGIGNGAIFFASESDKTPVQKWQTRDVQNTVIEKNKHIRIDVGGANSTNLHYNVGLKENADSIVEKIQLSKALSSSRASRDLDIDDTTSHPLPATASVPKVGKKASVHFSPASPVIIPSRLEGDDVQDIEGADQDQDGEDEDGQGEHAIALYDFTADGEDELTIQEGERLVILEKDGDEWWKCRNSGGVEGVVPASYLEISSPSPDSLSTPTGADVDGGKQEAEAAAREAEDRKDAERRERQEGEAQADKARKKQEAQERAREAAAAAEAERRKRKEASARASSPSVSAASEPRKSTENGSNGRQSSELSRPPPDQVRTWHDRSGHFRVDAAFLGLNNHKLRLHKVNGVIVEVPAEKMSLDDMRFVERLMHRKSTKASSSMNHRISEDDIPLAIARPPSSQRSSTQKKPAQIDWFDFFLSAGCDIDDCTRYAASFERDKIDETLLPDITESTMRSLGLREGDIIRVSKAIEKRKPTDNLYKPSSQNQEQIRKDEELARQLQVQENGGNSSRNPAPNLFAGPGGVLKGPRRRPQPSKAPPPSVDIKTLSNVSDQIQRTNSPQTASPAGTRPSTATPIQPPARSSSAAPAISGFDDDAWTNRPSSTKPPVSASPGVTPRVPSAPPTSAASAGAAVNKSTTQATVTPPATSVPSQSPTSIVPPTSSAPSLAKATESDIFDQLARLNELRKSSVPAPSALSPVVSSNVVAPPPASYQAGLGMGNSPAPMGQHLQNQQPVLLASPSSQVQPQPYNGPRGPYAPVPANQGLLQPLIPTQTGFNGFISTRPVNNPNSGIVPPIQATAPHHSFLTQQPTGLPNQMLLPQTTGVPFSGLNPTTFQSSSFGPGPMPMQSQFTGFNVNAGQLPLNNIATSPASPLSASNPSNNTSPANVFAQMKSGTFANEIDSSRPQPPDKYDALRPSPLVSQSTGWTQPYQSGFMGYQR
ncbi:hypothetical protein AX17_001295 [Amanita inopinata Kibby_2008]|nr:hypothetical protein AX17_001295 [Amanita inopinata Kibby_2008]